VYEATINRTAWQRRAAQGDAPTRTIETVDGVDKLVEVEADEVRTIEFPLGVDEEQLTTAVDVREFVDKKREAMRAHASQINDESFFLKMPEDLFAEAFGTEWFILRGAPAGIHEYDLFTGL
jgi:LmbE family N-acetylglucosaminyl deacetylase